MTEFFFEKDQIKNDILKIKDLINKFSVYTPNFTINFENLMDTKDKISSDLKLKLESYFIESDNQFSLKNFDYITQELGNQKLADIYQLLGPFDYSKY